MKFDKFAMLVGATLSIALLIAVAAMAIFTMGESERTADIERKAAEKRVLEVKNTTPPAQPVDIAD